MSPELKAAYGPPDFVCRPEARGTIWHVVASIDPKTGGPGAVVRTVSAECAARGGKAWILSGGPGIGQPEESAQIPGTVRTSTRAITSRVTGCRAPGLRRILEANLRRGDIVHLHGVWEALLWQSASLARARGVPYIVCPHGMLDRWSRRRSAWKKQIAWIAGAGRMLNHAAAIQCLTEQDRDEIGELRIASELHCIPNGIDLAEFEPVRRPESERRYLLYMGRIHPKKGLHLLIRVFKRIAAIIPDIDLVIAGPVEDGAYARMCHDLAAGCAARISWVGTCVGEEKRRLLSGALAFTLCSFQEGFSMAVLEAMASARPVVISHACRFPEVATAGAGLVTATDTESLNTALLDILAMPDNQRSAMGARGRALVEERYTISAITNQLFTLYRRLGADV